MCTIVSNSSKISGTITAFHIANIEAILIAYRSGLKRKWDPSACIWEAAIDLKPLDCDDIIKMGVQNDAMGTASACGSKRQILIHKLCLKGT